MAEDVKGRSEDYIQSLCFQWFWSTFPSLRRTLFAVPNGGSRNRAEASRMKATGTVAGVSDLIWVIPNRVIFIEMKTETGTQSEEQKEFQAQTEARGHTYIVLRSFEAFKAYILSIMALFKIPV